MQRRVALGVGAARIGAIGEQGHHGIGAAIVAVARRGDQWRQASVCAIEICPFDDQATQQTQIGVDGGEYQRRTLIAFCGCGSAIRVGAMRQCGKCELGLTRAHAAQQHRIQFVCAQACWQGRWRRLNGRVLGGRLHAIASRPPAFDQ